MKTGQIYWMVDPELDSSNVVDVRRIWARRVRVQLVRKHLLSLRRRYEVTYNNQTYRTGRLEKIKKAS